jgi:hypothetical protein
MKRILLTALLAALMLLPATAIAKRGHKVHRNHGQVGTITSFDSSTGELVITTTKGRVLSALVTDDTHIQCRDDNGDDDAGDDSTATASRHDGDDDHGDDNDDHGDNHGDDNDNDDHGDDNGHHGHHGHHASKCSTDDLMAGTVVRRARIDIDEDADAVWTKLKLA